MSKNLKLNRNSKIIAAVIILLLLAGAATAWALYPRRSPAAESDLRAQFGDDFFDHFITEPEPVDSDIALEEIINRYQPRFEELEAQSVEKLEALFQAALEEYRALKKSGNFDRFSFTNKYIQAGQLLEDGVDRTFYHLLGRMEEEISRRSLPTEVLEEIEAAYLEAKEAKKVELFTRLGDKLKR